MHFPIRIFILFLLLSPALNLAGQDNFVWQEERKLSWDDFTKIPDSRGKRAALTTYEISYELYYRDGRFIPVVNCEFVPSESWIKTGRQKDYILRHEQAHFDLAEVYARKIRKALAEITFVNRRPSRNPDDVFDELFAECERLQIQYDEETSHGTEDREQFRWERKIRDMLRYTRGYALNR